MDERVIADLCRELCATAGIGVPNREPIRVWRLSGVERLRTTHGATAVFKYATAPFTTENTILTHAAQTGVPVPVLHAATIREGILGMLMQDLGQPVHDATADDAATAAARLHHADPTPGLSTWDAGELHALPARMATRLAELQAEGRFHDTDDIADALTQLGQVAAARSEGADLAPFGLCHGEFHPTSLHIGNTGWRLLDLAKAFHGPGILDLASWQGTRNTPDPAKLRDLMRRYVTAGGHRDVLAERGGMPAELWALGWHRVWAAHWFLHQSACGALETEEDPVHMEIVRRQVAGAAAILTKPDPRRRIAAR